ncbi:MAG: hypothetical protein AAGA12_12325 [Pseudomonadota bacterium]
MKAFAVVANLSIPGVGSFIVGRIGEGIAQIFIWGIGFMLTVFTLGFGAVIGVPLMVGAWIWGLVTAFGYEQTQVTVNVNTHSEPPKS